MKTGRCQRCARGTIDGHTYTTRPDLREGCRPYGGRGLCKTCHAYENEHGRIEEWPRANWRREDLIDEWDRLRADGVGLTEAAERIGVKLGTLDRALHRALTDGDARARHNGCRTLKDRPGTESDLTTSAPGV